MSTVLLPYLQLGKGVKQKKAKTPLRRIDSTLSVLVGESEIKKKNGKQRNRLK
jgi:hypothetical protein